MEEKKKYPQLLLISHNALSKTNNNGKTIETFFAEWPKNKISHLYLSPENEDFDFCNNSYCINDYDMLDNFFSIRKKSKGRILNNENPNNIGKYSYLVNRLYKRARMTEAGNRGVLDNIHEKAVNRNPIVSLLRQILWRRIDTFFPSIIDWLNHTPPEAVFFQGSGVAYSYRIVERIAEYYKVPLFIECTDDYTLPLYPESRINVFLTNRYLEVFKRCIKRATAIYAISEKMANEYKELYGGDNYYVISNSVERNISENNKKDFTNSKIVFAGNLGLNRWEQIADFGERINEINNKYNTNSRLIIYSGSQLSDSQRERLNNISCIEFKGFISPIELDHEVENADFLLHVESFDEINKRITRLSISTKIGEYLASNRCIIAVGPCDIASIEYLNDKNLGYVFTEPLENYPNSTFFRMLTDKEKYSEYVSNGANEYQKRFTKAYIHSTIYNSVVGGVYFE